MALYRSERSNFHRSVASREWAMQPTRRIPSTFVSDCTTSCAEISACAEPPARRFDPAREVRLGHDNLECRLVVA